MKTVVNLSLFSIIFAVAIGTVTVYMTDIPITAGEYEVLVFLFAAASLVGVLINFRTAMDELSDHIMPPAQNRQDRDFPGM